jgi:hypothetical protein
MLLRVTKWYARTFQPSKPAMSGLVRPRVPLILTINCINAVTEFPNLGLILQKPCSSRRLLLLPVGVIRFGLASISTQDIFHGGDTGLDFRLDFALGLA